LALVFKDQSPSPLETDSNNTNKNPRIEGRSDFGNGGGGEGHFHTVPKKKKKYVHIHQRKARGLVERGKGPYPWLQAVGMYQLSKKKKTGGKRVSHTSRGKAGPGKVETSTKEKKIKLLMSRQSLQGSRVKWGVLDAVTFTAREFLKRSFVFFKGQHNGIQTLQDCSVLGVPEGGGRGRLNLP